MKRGKTRGYVKSVVNNLLVYRGINNVLTAYEGDNEVVWKWKNQVLCRATAVAESKLRTFDIKQEVYFAEVSWDTWQKAAAANKITYAEVPRFPAVQRDIAIIIDTDVTYKQIADTTEQLKLGALQKSLNRLDVFGKRKAVVRERNLTRLVIHFSCKTVP